MSSNKELDEKLKNIQNLGADAKVMRNMKKQTSKDIDHSTGTVEYSRDNEFIKGVEGEDKTKESRYEEEGVTFEPFNLQQENEEGYFDMDGNYVKHSRKGDEFDAWNDGLEDDEIKMNVFDPKLIKKKKIIQEEEKPINEIELFKLICSILNENENIKQALKRLAPIQKLPKTKQNKKKIEKIKENTMKINLVSDENFNKLSDAAFKLLENGYVEVYDDKKEIFEKKLNPKNDMSINGSIDTGNKNIKSIEEKEEEEEKWEYKWVEDSTNQIFGPFTTKQMKEWYNLGYFKQKPLVVRKVIDDIFAEELEFVSSEKYFN